MMYSVIDTGLAFENEPVYGVFEPGTKQVIAISIMKDTARVLARGLNMGNGFDGVTPAFFMNGRPQIIPSSDSSKLDHIQKS